MSTLLALLNILSPLVLLLCALMLHELTHVILNFSTVGLYLGTIIYSVGGKNDYQLITCDKSP